MNNESFNQSEYNKKLSQVTVLAVNYAKTGIGYFRLREGFEELCEKSDAIKSINRDASVSRSVLLAQKICNKAIFSLSVAQNDCLEAQLKEMAEDYQKHENANRRGFHR